MKKWKIPSLFPPAGRLAIKKRLSVGTCKKASFVFIIILGVGCGQHYVQLVPEPGSVSQIRIPRSVRVDLRSLASAKPSFTREHVVPFRSKNLLISSWGEGALVSSENIKSTILEYLKKRQTFLQVVEGSSDLILHIDILWSPYSLRQGFWSVFEYGKFTLSADLETGENSPEGPGRRLGTYEVEKRTGRIPPPSFPILMFLSHERYDVPVNNGFNGVLNQLVSSLEQDWETKNISDPGKQQR